MSFSFKKSGYIDLKNNTEKITYIDIEVNGYKDYEKLERATETLYDENIESVEQETSGGSSYIEDEEVEDFVNFDEDDEEKEVWYKTIWNHIYRSLIKPLMSW